MLLTPTTRFPKGTDAGVTVISGDGSALLAVPLRFTFTTASSGSLEGIRSVAVLRPAVVALSFTLTVQDWPAARVRPSQRLAATTNLNWSGLRPARVSVPGTSAVTPSFRTVTVLPALLVPIATLL